MQRLSNLCSHTNERLLSSEPGLLDLRVDYTLYLGLAFCYCFLSCPIPFDTGLHTNIIPSHFITSPYFVGLVCLLPCLMFKVCLKICRSATWGPDSMMEATLKSGYRLSNLVSPLVIKVI